MSSVVLSGEFYAFTCASLWAVAIVLFRKSGETVPPLALNLFKNTIGLVLLVVTMLAVGTSFAPPDMSVLDWVTLLGSGLVGIAVADTMLFASLNRLGAGGSAVVDCLYSPLVILCAVVYLGEPLNPVLIASMALISGAIVVGTWGPQAALPQTSRRARIEGIVLGAASMLLMAMGIVAAKPVLERADVWWATAVRLTGALPLLLVLGALPRHRAHVLRAFTPGRHWRVLMPSAVIGAYLAMVLWILGFKLTSAGVAGLLNQTSTITVLVLATLFLHEPLTWRKAVAIGMGFGGAVLVVL
ncbi:MAG: DMT family transporter [Pseudomonadota bacterium]